MVSDLEKKLSPEHKKIYKNIVLIATIFTIVLLLLIVFFVVKQKSGDSCGATNNRFYNERVVINGYKLNHTGDYLLQEIPLVEDHVKASFCYRANLSSNHTLQMQVINEQEEVLGVGWINNVTDLMCHEINLDEGTTKQFIGIKCVSCNETDYVTLKKEYSSAQKKLFVLKNDDDFLTDYSNVYAMSIKTLDDCRKTIKFLLSTYFTLIGLLFLVVLMMIGFRSFRDFLFKDW